MCELHGAFVFTILLWARCVKPNTDQERDQKEFCGLGIPTVPWGENTACHAGPLRAPSGLVMKQRKGGELWDSTFTLVSVGKKGQSQASRFRIG